MLVKRLILLCLCNLVVVGCSSRSIDEQFLSTFAGEYGNNQVLTIQSLTINSDGTFTDVIWTDISAVFTLTGIISLELNDMTLQYDPDEQGFSREIKLTPVLWGDRKYLLGSEDIVGRFCNGVADGSAIQRDDEGNLLFIFAHKNNPNASVFGVPEYLNGEKVCPSVNPEEMK